MSDVEKTMAGTEVTAILSGDIARQTTLQRIERVVDALFTMVGSQARKLEEIMTQDATVAAEAAEIVADVATLTAAIGDIQASFATLEQEVAAGAPTAATMQALSDAISGLDSLTAAGTADAAADAAAVTPTTGA